MFAASPQEPNAANAYIDIGELDWSTGEPQPDSTPSNGHPSSRTMLSGKPWFASGRSCRPARHSSRAYACGNGRSGPPCANSSASHARSVRMAPVKAESRNASWAGKRALVTGAAGFIGSHLTEALVRAGADVRAFVRYNSRNDYGWLEVADESLIAEVEIFRGDLENPEAVRGATAKCDVVLHLGALIPIPYSYRHPREFVTANVIGTLNVLEACREAEVSRLVHTSTSEVYGTAVHVPIDEEHRLQTQSPYAATKLGADKLALSYQQSFDTPVVVARPFNTFGPRQTARAIIPTIITQALTQQKIRLGSTTPTRDFLFVEDTVDGMMRCAEQSGIEGEVFNLGTGREISIGETADRIQALLGIALTIEQSDDRRRPPNSEVERLVADCSRAAARLDWRPRIEFDEGLRQTVEWIRVSLAKYKPSIYNV